MGLANRLFSSRDELLQGAQDLAQQLAAFPQLCLRADRRSTRAQHGLPRCRLLQRTAERRLQRDGVLARERDDGR